MLGSGSGEVSNPWGSCTVGELKGKLKELGLPTAGMKNELIVRLQEAGAQVAEIREQESDERAESARSSIARGHDGRRKREDGSRRDEPEIATGTRETEIEIMRHERDLAEREVRVLRREMELLRMATSAPAPAPVMATAPHERTVTWKAAKDMIGNFDAESGTFRNWDKQVRSIVRMYELSLLEAKALVCSKLQGKAARWYQSRDDCVDLTYTEVLDELGRMYDHRPNKLRLRRDFEARQWKHGESFTEYLHEKITLGNVIPIDPDEMIEYIIDGIPDERLQSQARIRQFQSVDQIANAFSRIALPKDTKGAASWRKSASRVQIAETSDVKAKTMVKPESEKKFRCFNCNKPGHRAADCKSSRRQRGACFRCGSLEHLMQQCTVDGSSQEIRN